MRRVRGLTILSAAGVLALAPGVGSAPKPFTLGPNPVTATGTFANGRGGCPFAASFTDTFRLHAPGNGTLTITQPSTGDEVSGPIAPDGAFALRSAGESYVGRIAGGRLTAIYTYTANSCTQTYDATFALPESDLELRLTAPARATITKTSFEQRAVVTYRIVVTNNGDSTSPAATAVLRFSRPLQQRALVFGGRNGLPENDLSCPNVRGAATVVVTCRVPELHRGEAAGVGILVVAHRPGSYVARGTVAGVNFDPVTANNRATRTTTVRR